MKNILLAFVVTIGFQVGAIGAAGVSVHVTDPQQKPIAGAIVTLTSRSTEHWSATTDTAGACAFPVTAAGEYFLEASAPGFDPAAPRTISVQPGALSDIS